MADFFARSVSAAKWRVRANIAADEVPADGVGADLRTSDNELSFWQCDAGMLSSLEEVVLVLASTRDQVQRMDLIWLPADDVAGMRIGIRRTPGATPVVPLNHRHRDLTGIDLSRLILLADGVAQAVAGDRIRRFTEKQVTDILAEAVKRGIVQAQSLKPSVAAKIAT